MSTTGLVDVCAVGDLLPGGRRIIEHDFLGIGIFNIDGVYFAIEDRCSHDDGPLCEGELDPLACTITCPRHGSVFDLRTGDALTLPAYEPVDVFPVIIDDDIIKLEVN